MPLSCPPACGGCCDPVVLGTDPERPGGILDPDARDADGPDHPNTATRVFVLEHWTVRKHAPDGDHLPGRRPFPGEHWQVECAMFDRDTRRCGAYDARPPICAQYPWYDRTPEAGEWLAELTCVYQDEVPGRRVLPLTVIHREKELS